MMLPKIFVQSHCCVICFLFMQISLVQATEYELPLVRLIEQHQLSQVSINTITADATGSLWIGTQDGLNRYRGQSLRQWNNNQPELPKVAGHHIQQLYFKKKQDLWVVSGEAIEHFNQTNNQFQRLSLPERFALNAVTADRRHLLIDDENNLWLAQGNSIHLLALTKAFSDQDDAYTIDWIASTTSAERVLVMQ